MPMDVNAIIVAINAPPAPFVPEQLHFAPGYALLLVGFNGTPEHAQLVSRIREALPPLFDMVSPMPYVALQAMFDEADAWGSYFYEKTVYIADLSDPVIETVIEHVPRRSLPRSDVKFFRLDGAYSQVGELDTAFSGGRSPRFGVFICAMTPDSTVLAAERTWARNLWTRCAHTPSAVAARATSTPWRSSARTGYARPTAPKSMTSWPGSRPSTTRTMSSTTCQHQAGPTSGRQSGRDDLPRQCGWHVVVTHERALEGAGAMGDRAQVDRVPGQLMRRHLSVNYGVAG
jgi:hypothetical protein